MDDLQELLDELGYDDWTVDDDVATCPHGHLIEHDGTCPEGCVSPMRELGWI